MYHQKQKSAAVYSGLEAMKFKTQMTHAEVRAKSWHGNDINKTLTEIILFPFQRLTFTNTWSAQAGIFKVQLKMFWDPEERYAVEMYFKWTSFSALKIILRKLLNWHKAIHQTMQNIFFPFFFECKASLTCNNIGPYMAVYEFKMPQKENSCPFWQPFKSGAGSEQAWFLFIMKL